MDEKTIQNILKIKPEKLVYISCNPATMVRDISKMEEIYTAKINAKIRMHIKPIGEYPYKLEEIIEVELIEIDEKHYGEG